MHDEALISSWLAVPAAQFVHSELLFRPDSMLYRPAPQGSQLVASLFVENVPSRATKG